MNSEQYQLLSLRHPPARLTPQEAAWLMGFSAHEIPILISARLLKPLGNPPKNGCKHFSAIQLKQLCADPLWLGKASDAIVKHWKAKNGRRSTGTAKIKHRDGLKSNEETEKCP